MDQAGTQIYIYFRGEDNSVFRHDVWGTFTYMGLKLKKNQSQNRDIEVDSIQKSWGSLNFVQTKQRATDRT